MSLNLTDGCSCAQKECVGLKHPLVAPIQHSKCFSPVICADTKHFSMFIGFAQMVQVFKLLHTFCQPILLTSSEHRTDLKPKKLK